MRTILLSLMLLIHIIPLYAQRMTRADLRKDIETIIQTIESVHYNPYLYTNKQTFLQYRDSLLSTLPPDISAEDAYITLNLLTARLDDGHTQVRLPAGVKDSLHNSAVFPFRTTRLYIAENLSRNHRLQKGDSLISINDRNADSLYRLALSCNGGLPSSRQSEADDHFYQYLYALGIQSPFRIRYYSMEQHITDTITVAGIPFSDLRSQAANAWAGKDYYFQRLDKNIAYINFRNMQNIKAFRQLLDSSFSDIRKRPVTGLIVDLRENGGGDSDLGELLLSYITDKSFRLSAGKYWKVSADYKIFMRSNRKDWSKKEYRTYQSARDGSVLEEKYAAHLPAPNPLRYRGPVFVLTGAGTFSSANMLADAIKTYHLATLIGQPTGEATNDFGEVYTFTPRICLTVTTTTTFDLGANGNSQALMPVNPDILIKEEAGKDNALEYAIHAILQHQ